MSILIKGMEMPKSCLNCFLSRSGCRAVLKRMRAMEAGTWIPANYRHDDCPLVPVPPHGDLIDRNKLYEKVAEWEAQALHMVEVTMHDEDTTEWRKWSTVLTERSAFKFDVADAPTIIPADKEEKV